jgi:hypothetical protein
MVCVYLVGPFTIRTPAKTHSLLVITMKHQATGWFEIVGVKNKSASSIQEFFFTTGWHVTHDLNLLSLTTVIRANSNMRSSKCVRIMALKQPKVHKEMQSLREYIRLWVVNRMLRSFYLENNHENLEEDEGTP